MSFFEEQAYKNLVKISNRLSEKCTLKNVILYWKYNTKCIELAMEKYNDIGYTNNGYKWVKPINKAEEEYTKEDCSRLEKYALDYDSMLKEHF